jgi:hypothetical protein
MTDVQAPVGTTANIPIESGRLVSLKTVTVLAGSHSNVDSGDLP